MGALGAIARRGRAAIAAVLVVLSLSNVAVIREDIAAFRRGGFPQYIPEDVVRGIREFGRTAPPNAALLAHQSVSLFVPALTGRRVYAGHYMLTIDLARKTESVRAFYDAGTPDAARRAFLAGSAITHVFLSPVERGLGSADLDAMPFLEEVAHEGSVRLYRVRRDAL
jgi:hypothetical protein